MESWGSDVPLGTIMTDHITYKTYKWNGKNWILHKSGITPNFESPLINIKRFDMVFNSFDTKVEIPKRGRPKKKGGLECRTRPPSEYNLYVKQQILENVHPLLKGREKLKQIARDWKNLNHCTD